MKHVSDIVFVSFEFIAVHLLLCANNMYLGICPECVSSTSFLLACQVVVIVIPVDCARDRLPGEQFCTIVPLVSWSVGALSPVNH